MKLELQEEYFKVPSQYTLVETEFYRLTTEEEGVAIPVESSKGKLKGFFVLAQLEIVVDAIVHSPKGSIGRVVKQKCPEMIFLGESVPDDWELILPDSRREEYNQRAEEFVEWLNSIQGKSSDIDIGLDKSHVIVAPHSVPYPPSKSTWLVVDAKDSMVLVHNGEVFVRNEDTNLVYVSSQDRKVEIIGSENILTLGGPGGITFNHKGKDVTLGEFLHDTLSNLRDSFRSWKEKITVD